MLKLPTFYFSGQYETLSTDESKRDPTIGEEKIVQCRDRRWVSSIWIFTTFIFVSISAWQAAELHTRKFSGSFEEGFATEFEPARHLIEVKRVSFTGSPHFHPDGKEYVQNGAAAAQYIGNPSRAIDHAWASLTFGRFILLTEEEAKNAWGNEYVQFWSPKDGGYVAGLEMLHTLHCLDHIRKAFYPDVYPLDSPIHGVMHRDHCIDHLRQMIMCNADITPIPSRFYSGIDQNYIDSDRPHTCRNFKKIREWVTERWNGTLKVQPQNPTGATNDEWINGP